MPKSAGHPRCAGPTGRGHQLGAPGHDHVGPYDVLAERGGTEHGARRGPLEGGKRLDPGRGDQVVVVEDGDIAPAGDVERVVERCRTPRALDLDHGGALLQPGRKRGDAGPHGCQVVGTDPVRSDDELEVADGLRRDAGERLLEAEQARALRTCDDGEEQPRGVVCRHRTGQARLREQSVEQRRGKCGRVAVRRLRSAVRGWASRGSAGDDQRPGHLERVHVRGAGGV